MRLAALVLFIVMGASSSAAADPVNGHDVPFSMADVAVARSMCGESPTDRSDRDADYCTKIREMSDVEVLERIEAFRTNCLDWIDIEPRVTRLIEAHDPFLQGASPHGIDALCAVPQPLRPGTYARVGLDPGFLAATVSRLTERAGNAEKAEAFSEELLAELQSGYASLRVQTSEGRLKAATAADLREHLNTCSELIEDGPMRMLEGGAYEIWETNANRCVEASTESVFKYARDGEPRDLTWMWWTTALGLIVSISLLVLWNRRHGRALGHVAITEWQAKISDARHRLEESARKAEDDRARAEHNLMFARLAALSDWTEAFGDDATEPDVRRSAELAHINKRDYQWSGFDGRVPPASVSGSADEFMARVQRFNAIKEDHDE